MAIGFKTFVQLWSAHRWLFKKKLAWQWVWAKILPKLLASVRQRAGTSSLTSKPLPHNSVWSLLLIKTLFWRLDRKFFLSHTAFSVGNDAGGILWLKKMSVRRLRLSITRIFTFPQPHTQVMTMRKLPAIGQLRTYLAISIVTLIFKTLCSISVST